MPNVSRLLAAGAVASAATLALGGTAAWAMDNPVVTKNGSTYTLKLHSHTTKQGFIPKGGTETTEEPKGAPKEGDAFTFVDENSQDGKIIGSDEGKCTVIKASEKSATSHCVVSVKFNDGTLAVEGNLTFSMDDSDSGTETFALVGGTGAYAGAKGKALVKDTNETDSDITVIYTLDGSQVAEMPTGGAATGDGSTAGTENLWLYGVGAAAMAGGALVLAGSRRAARR